MKLTEDLKKHIDTYFENKTSEELVLIGQKYNLIMNEYLSLSLSLRLKDVGYDKPSNMMYCHNYRVKDEILKEYPNLSDDGYLELTKEHGGQLDKDDVYGYYDEAIYARCINDKFHFEDYPDMLCVCPKISNVIEWLRVKKDIFINIYPDFNVLGKVIYTGKIIFIDRIHNAITYYDINEKCENYYKVCEEGINFVIKILENGN